MAEWKLSIKSLAEDFCMSQVKVNRMIKKIENIYAQREIPVWYKGNRDEFLYDKAQREMMNILYT